MAVTQEALYMCPVCDRSMNYPPKDWHICPTCGIEFNYEVSENGPFEDFRKRFQGGERWL